MVIPECAWYVESRNAFNDPECDVPEKQYALVCGVMCVAVQAAKPVLLLRLTTATNSDGHT